MTTPEHQNTRTPEHQNEIPFRGRIFRIVQRKFENGKVFEIAERAPGVRVIIDNKEDGRILLSREFRHEIDGYDYRLPGGKVFDRLEDYETCPSEDLPAAAENQAKVEAREEVGIDIQELSHLGTSTLGATVKRDLYMYVTTNWAKLEAAETEDEAEDISAEWFEYETVKKMIVDGSMSEERVALWLLRYLNQS
jgi:ADP-ribose pyrophosphatase